MLCVIAGTSFALFAGRSVTRRHTVAATVTQSVELVPQCQRHPAAVMDKSADDDVDSLQPGVPLMTQDFAAASRCAALDNNIVQLRHSQVDLPAAESSPRAHFTHSQLISIV